MSVAKRPDFDDVAETYGNYLTQPAELKNINVGTKLDVLCRDKINYVARVEKIDSNRNIRLHFMNWSDKYDYVGPLGNLYVAPEGHFSKGVLNSNNQYINPKSVDDRNKRPRREATKDASKSDYAANSRYDPDFLSKPYINNKKRKPLDKDFVVGDRVEVKRPGTWYPGQVTGVHRVEFSFDVVYDDGEKEERVPADRVRVSSAPAAATVAIPITLPTPTIAMPSARTSARTSITSVGASSSTASSSSSSSSVSGEKISIRSLASSSRSPSRNNLKRIGERATKKRSPDSGASSSSSSSSSAPNTNTNATVPAAATAVPATAVPATAVPAATASTAAVTSPTKKAKIDRNPQAQNGNVKASALARIHPGAQTADRNFNPFITTFGKHNSMGQQQRPRNLSDSLHRIIPGQQQQPGHRNLHVISTCNETAQERYKKEEQQEEQEKEEEEEEEEGSKSGEKEEIGDKEEEESVNNRDWSSHMLLHPNWKKVFRKQLQQAQASDSIHKSSLATASVMSWLDKWIPTVRSEGSLTGHVYGPLGMYCTVQTHGDVVIPYYQNMMKKRHRNSQILPPGIQDSRLENSFVNMLLNAIPEQLLLRTYLVENDSDMALLSAKFVKRVPSLKLEKQTVDEMLFVVEDAGNNSGGSIKYSIQNMNRILRKAEVRKQHQQQELQRRQQQYYQQLQNEEGSKRQQYSSLLHRTISQNSAIELPDATSPAISPSSATMTQKQMAGKLPNVGYPTDSPYYAAGLLLHTLNCPAPIKLFLNYHCELLLQPWMCSFARPPPEALKKINRNSQQEEEAGPWILSYASKWINRFQSVHGLSTLTCYYYDSTLPLMTEGEGKGEEIGERRRLNVQKINFQSPADESAPAPKMEEIDIKSPFLLQSTSKWIEVTGEPLPIYPVLQCATTAATKDKAAVGPLDGTNDSVSVFTSRTPAAVSSSSSSQSARRLASNTRSRRKKKTSEGEGLVILYNKDHARSTTTTTTTTTTPSHSSSYGMSRVHGEAEEKEREGVQGDPYRQSNGTFRTNTDNISFTRSSSSHGKERGAADDSLPVHPQDQPQDEPMLRQLISELEHGGVRVMHRKRQQVGLLYRTTGFIFSELGVELDSADYPDQPSVTLQQIEDIFRLRNSSSSSNNSSSNRVNHSSSGDGSAVIDGASSNSSNNTTNHTGSPHNKNRHGRFSAWFIPLRQIVKDTGAAGLRPRKVSLLDMAILETVPSQVWQQQQQQQQQEEELQQHSMKTMMSAERYGTAKYPILVAATRRYGTMQTQTAVVPFVVPAMVPGLVFPSQKVFEKWMGGHEEHNGTKLESKSKPKSELDPEPAEAEPDPEQDGGDVDRAAAAAGEGEREGESERDGQQESVHPLPSQSIGKPVAAVALSSKRSTGSARSSPDNEEEDAVVTFPTAIDPSKVVFISLREVLCDDAVDMKLMLMPKNFIDAYIYDEDIHLIKSNSKSSAGSSVNATVNSSKRTNNLAAPSSAAASSHMLFNDITPVPVLQQSMVMSQYSQDISNQRNGNSSNTGHGQATSRHDPYKDGLHRTAAVSSTATSSSQVLQNSPYSNKITAAIHAKAMAATAAAAIPMQPRPPQLATSQQQQQQLSLSPRYYPPPSVSTIDQLKNELQPLKRVAQLKGIIDGMPKLRLGLLNAGIQPGAFKELIEAQLHLAEATHLMLSSSRAVSASAVSASTAFVPAPVPVPVPARAALPAVVEQTREAVVEDKTASVASTAQSQPDPGAVVSATVAVTANTQQNTEFSATPTATTSSITTIAGNNTATAEQSKGGEEEEEEEEKEEAEAETIEASAVSSTKVNDAEDAI